MTRIQWRSELLHTDEQCELTETADGYRIAGIVFASLDRHPIRIDYTIDLDDGWRTRSVRATVFDKDGPRTLDVTGDGNGRWRVDGTADPALDGCMDIDLECTPATNTLPIRRLGLWPGETERLDAAWITFPELEVQRLPQAYQHLTEHSWLYSSENFQAILAVDSEGLVLSYGDLWKAVAHSDPELLVS